MPQISSELAPSLAVEVEVGYRLNRRVAPFVALGYSQPTVENTGSLASGSYTAVTLQRELTATMGGLWWFLPARSSLNVYAGLGGRVYLLESVSNGQSAGQLFGENRETSIRLGGMVALGLQLTSGRGAVAGQISLGGSDLSHVISGDVATTALCVSLGYRMFFQ